jgi:peptidoglycan/LPS O-acetylase OafA/YrhL
MQTPSHELAHLDAARAGAALLVLIHHVRNLLFVDYGSIGSHPNLLLSASYALTSLGREAVMVFFVLSGFLIATAIGSAVASGGWSLWTYALRRVTRLWVVLLPALLLTVVLDRSAIAWLPGGRLYVHPPAGEAVLSYSAASNDSPLVLLGNVVFLQEIVVAPYGSNSPLWSLAYEFWYYVAFPLLFFAAAGPGRWYRRVVLAALGLAVLVFAGKTISMYFSVWLLGASVALAYRRWRTAWRAPFWLAPGAAFALVGVLTVARFIPTPFLRDFAIGVAFTALLVGVRFRPPARTLAAYEVIAAWLAGAAYTVYLVHFPALLFFRAWLEPTGRIQPTAANAMLGLVVTASVLAVALAFAQLTERQTDAARGWVEHKIARWRQLEAL